MSKERLQEVAKNVVFLQCGFTGAPMGVELPEDDYWYLYEQAERVQVLERKIGRYREAIERALDESGWGDEGNALHKMISILTKTLEVEDDGKNKKTAGQHNDYQRTVIRVW